MTLDAVVDLLVEHLSMKELSRLWIALGTPVCLFQDESSVAVLARRMRLHYRKRMTMSSLVMRMRTTRRCFECGVPAKSRVVFASCNVGILCSSCTTSVLLTRVEVRQMVERTKRTHPAVKLTKTPWKQLVVAKRTRTGAHLYWRHEIDGLIIRSLAASKRSLVT
jgi:hypothetical protein